jgi:hypothetical protein
MSFDNDHPNRQALSGPGGAHQSEGQAATGKVDARLSDRCGRWSVRQSAPVTFSHLPPKKYQTSEAFSTKESSMPRWSMSGGFGPP